MFDEYGYFKEYYINGKFVGIVNDIEKDREIMGFFGSKTETTTEIVILSNNKKIKPNTIVTTQLHYLNGTKK